MPTLRPPDLAARPAAGVRFGTTAVLLTVLLVSAAARAGMPLRYDKAAFEQAVRAHAPVVLHVCAGWSPICQVQKPAVQQLLLQEPALGPVRLFVADYDRERQLRGTLGVYQQSTFVVFAGGHEVARSTGETSREALRALFAKALSASGPPGAGAAAPGASSPLSSLRRPRP